MIRTCCGTPDDARSPSPHARDCRAIAAPNPSGGPYPLRSPLIVTCPRCSARLDGLGEYESHARREHDRLPVAYRGDSGTIYTVTGPTVTARYPFGAVVPMTFGSWRDALMYASSHGKRMA